VGGDPRPHGHDLVACWPPDLNPADKIVGPLYAISVFTHLSIGSMPAERIARGGRGGRLQELPPAKSFRHTVEHQVDMMRCHQLPGCRLLPAESGFNPTQSAER
jgi:hypothetical protein